MSIIYFCLSVFLSFFKCFPVFPLLTEDFSEHGAKESVWTPRGKKLDKFWVKFHNEELRDQFFLPPLFG